MQENKIKCTAYNTQIFVFFVGHTRHTTRPLFGSSCVAVWYFFFSMYIRTYTFVLSQMVTVCR